MTKRVIEKEPRYCALGWCGKRLVQGEDETPHNFLKRNTCGYSCASQKKMANRSKKAKSNIPLGSRIVLSSAIGGDPIGITAPVVRKK